MRLTEAVACGTPGWHATRVGSPFEQRIQLEEALTLEPTAPGADTKAGSEIAQRAPVSRRRVLQTAAAIGVTAVVGPLAERFVQLADAAEPHPGADMSGMPAGPTRRWAMVIDLRRCDGCGHCTDACQANHYLPPEQTWLKVYELTDASGNTYFMPRPCMQCENPPCVRVCPVGASFQTDEGVVLVDQTKCIGCRMCMAACPYEARYFNWADPQPVPRLPTAPSPEFPAPQQKGTVGKCIFCVHQTRYGKLPFCVDGCPMGAIYIGDLNEDVAVNGVGESVRLSTFLKENDAIRFKEELNTRPRVYYIAGHGQDLEY